MLNYQRVTTMIIIIITILPSLLSARTSTSLQPSSYRPLAASPGHQGIRSHRCCLPGRPDQKVADGNFEKLWEQNMFRRSVCIYIYIYMYTYIHVYMICMSVCIYIYITMCCVYILYIVHYSAHMMNIY